MKKLLIRAAIAVLVLIILLVLVIGLFLDAAIKKGIETVGPAMTKVDVKLDGVTLSLLSGSGKIKGLVIGNPQGYKMPSAIQVGSASLALKPGSLLSDKIVITSINVQAPEITYETNFKQSNLDKILSNLKESTSGHAPKQPSPPNAPPAQKEPTPAQQAKANKKLEVDDFVISGAKVHVSITTLGQSATVPIPDIHLTDLGKGPEGITAAELTKLVLQEIETKAATAASGAASELSKSAQDIGKNATKSASDAAQSVTKGLGDLLKSK